MTMFKMIQVVFACCLFLGANATQCPNTVCTNACGANSCNTVFGTGNGRRNVGDVCSQTGIEVKCTNPPSNPSLGYANAHAYWCGPEKTVADCGNIQLNGQSVDFCQGAACLLVDGEYVWNCYEGHFLDQNKCSKCYTGQYRSDADVVTGKTCKACSQGAYQDEVGGILCKACPAGYRVTSCSTNDATAYAGWVGGEPAHTGCTSCEPCPSGQYQTTHGNNQCTMCPSGKYGKQSALRNSENAACVTCPNGRWTGQNTGLNGMAYSSPACLACPPGKYGTGGTCQDCTASLGVTTTPGLSACVKCNVVQAGTVWASPTSCTPCLAGTQPEAPAYSQCKDCPLGQYSPNGVPCTTCPLGTEPNVANKATQCDQCSPGQYQTGAMNECQNCPTGKQDKADQSECDVCTAGKVAANSGQSSCATCQAGTAATVKTSACSTCIAGQWFSLIVLIVVWMFVFGPRVWDSFLFWYPLSLVYFCGVRFVATVVLTRVLLCLCFFPLSPQVNFHEI
jgi:hypothetical protein